MNRVSTKVRVPDLAAMKERGERIVMLTAYDATMARLLSYDMLGLFDEFVPKFVRQYAQLGEAILSATRAFANDVRQGTYPQPAPARHDRGLAQLLAESLAASTG